MGKLASSLVLSACYALAASDDAAIQRTFVRPWIEALRSKDKARIEEFFHPAVRACVNPGTKEFFDQLLEHEADSEVSGAYHITKLAPIQGPPPALLPEDGFAYPVRAIYELQVDFEQGDRSFIRFLAPSKGSWFQKKTAELLMALKDPLRSELRDLLRQQRKIDAVKKYREASSVDLTTAVMVINALQQSSR